MYFSITIFKQRLKIHVSHGFWADWKRIDLSPLDLSIWLLVEPNVVNQLAHEERWMKNLGGAV